jgi:thioredoxin-like negative regulator of GroEL
MGAPTSKCEHPDRRDGALESIAEVTDTTFADLVFKSPIPVLVEFWAPWAKACAVAEPPLVGATRAFEPSLGLLRCNVEESPMAATVYGVRRIPLVVLFRQGEELDRWSGSLSAAEVTRRVRAACSREPEGPTPAPEPGAER